MLIVDANVLIYAVAQDQPHHEAARGWLDERLSGPEPVGFSWGVMLAFLRLTAHSRVFERPLDPATAAGVLRMWLEQPASVVVHPDPAHLEILTGLIEASGTAGNLVNDAHLAALAVARSAAIVSFDSDFARFPGVRLVRPDAA